MCVSSGDQLADERSGMSSIRLNSLGPPLQNPRWSLDHHESNQQYQLESSRSRHHGKVQSCGRVLHTPHLSVSVGKCVIFRKCVIACAVSRRSNVAAALYGAAPVGARHRSSLSGNTSPAVVCLLGGNRDLRPSCNHLAGYYAIWRRVPYSVAAWRHSPRQSQNGNDERGRRQGACLAWG